ncbi:PREDICTED: uncharacterized protein LOC109149074 [Ipomoea nil]|uniref:uncharacterized protein LOC109149074 n=1 Tax=Ipomoea nil TaxID=35883 RepID=UPI000901B99E|nr:PREDICTED: uncharacterized protein LOC109149074 [Ipomoea nil]
MDDVAGGSPSAAQPVAEGEAQRAPHTNKRVKILKRSFAETATTHPMLDDDQMAEVTDDDWLGDGFVVEPDKATEDTRDGIPVAKFSKAFREDLVKPWRKALIIKFLGKPPAFPLLKQRLIKLWNINEKVEMIDIGYSYYIIHFNVASEYRHVLLDGPWKLFGCYVIPQRWRLNFDPQTAKMEKMTVWVRLPGLGAEYYRDDAVKNILNHVGNPIKLDRCTSGIDRGMFARAAVEIDLSKPLVSMIWVLDRIQKVEFEGLHTICFTCGEVGHVSNHCNLNKPPEQNIPDTNPTSEMNVNDTGKKSKIDSRNPPKQTTAKTRPKESTNKGKRVVVDVEPETSKTAAARGKSKKTSPPVNKEIDDLHETPIFLEGDPSGKQKTTKKPPRSRRGKPQKNMENSKQTNAVKDNQPVPQPTQRSAGGFVFGMTQHNNSKDISLEKTTDGRQSTVPNTPILTTLKEGGVLTSLSPQPPI